VLNPEIQKKILEIYYQKWRDSFPGFYAVGDMEIEGVEKECIVANAEYLARQGLIEEPRTTGFLSKITTYGIDSVEDKRISEDVEVRRRILEILGKEFETDPQRPVAKEKLVERSSFSEIEIERNLWYLEEQGFVEVHWALGGAYATEITGMGIEALKEPSVLEQEVIVMSNAYSMLYQLENSLRIFVEKKLRDSFGNSWWERGVSQREIREGAERKKAVEPESNLSLINYTEFDDLRRIITNNWEIFRDTFQTQTGIVSRLEELEPMRNKIAHSRLLSNEDLAKLELFSKEISVLIS
jgi:hypothetical protein